MLFYTLLDFIEKEVNLCYHIFKGKYISLTEVSARSRKEDPMKFLKVLFVLLLVCLSFSSCGKTLSDGDSSALQTDAVEILLSDEKITADGKEVGNIKTEAVYTARDIVYYQDGKDFTYGEGSEKDAHSAEEAGKHTVLHITQKGVYKISGKLSFGQIAIDLGEGAKTDPEAVVTLILDGVDINCSAAPAIIFYNVYECGDGKAKKDVDTSEAGANVIIADKTVNNIKGSYVERIYKPDSVVLNEDKTEVKDAKKLHKYDGAFYSKMSMNVKGEKENTGVLNIDAENEGLDTEMHLTIDGGIINIESGNDGINTNEDGLSVTTILGGEVNIKVTGESGEGDGIDSNGYLVIRGGKVSAFACSLSADSGIDSDLGIHILGGEVIASGNMLDRIEEGGQNYVVFNFKEKQKEGEKILLKNKEGNSVFEICPENAYSILIWSSPSLSEGTYTLWSGEKQLAGEGGGMLGGGMQPEGMEPPEKEEGEFSQDRPPKDFQKPQGEEKPEDFEMPEGFAPPEKEEGKRPEKPVETEGVFGGVTADFVIRSGGNMFGQITDLQ